MADGEEIIFGIMSKSMIGMRITTIVIAQYDPHPPQERLDGRV